MREHLLDLLRKIRTGLGLPDSNVHAINFADETVMIFKYDEKLYRLVLEQIDLDSTKLST